MDEFIAAVNDLMSDLPKYLRTEKENLRKIVENLNPNEYPSERMEIDYVADLVFYLSHAKLIYQPEAVYAIRDYLNLEDWRCVHYIAKIMALFEKKPSEVKIYPNLRQLDDYSGQTVFDILEKLPYMINNENQCAAIYQLIFSDNTPRYTHNCKQGRWLAQFIRSSGMFVNPNIVNVLKKELQECTVVNHFVDSLQKAFASGLIYPDVADINVQKEVTRFILRSNIPSEPLGNMHTSLMLHVSHGCAYDKNLIIKALHEKQYFNLENHLKLLNILDCLNFCPEIQGIELLFLQIRKTYRILNGNKQSISRLFNT